MLFLFLLPWLNTMVGLAFIPLSSEGRSFGKYA